MQDRPWPSGTVAFLFTDIEGSTRRWERDAPRMRQAVDRHFELLKAQVDAHQGVQFKSVGDAIQSAFDTADEAICAAIDAQRTLSMEPWPDEVGDLRVRMAVHVCDARHQDGDYVAPGLNLLSRLLGAAHGGQILVSETASQLAAKSLPRDAELLDLGVHRLRDIELPSRIFQVVAPELREEFSAIKSLPLDWPAAPTPLFGREDDTEGVTKLLEQTRLVTLVGAPGIGKTRLALSVAEELSGKVGGGLFFVDLSSIDDFNQVVFKIAEGLGVRQEVAESLEDAVKAKLRFEPALLILDNFEHVIGATRVVTSLLTAIPTLRILATSREPLNLTHSGEHLWHVEPLEIPTSEAAQLFEDAGQVPAVALFVDAVGRHQHQFQLTPQNVDDVVTVCCLLEGIPLAINLAAPLLVGASVREIALDLQKQLPNLQSEGSDLPLRHRTMRAAIAWSYDRLTADEKALFRHLTVFRGGCFRDAAEKVSLAGGPSKRGKIRQNLRSLVQKGLLRRSEVSSLSRYTMFSAIREFGEELLSKPRALQEQEDLQRLHTIWFRGLAERLEEGGVGESSEDRLELMSTDLDNFRSALERA